MMREIKFRGWYGEKIGMMVPTFNGNINEIFKEAKGVYMQYTGLKDKNGIDVYEGDVLKRVVHLKMLGADLDQKIDDIVEVEWREDYSGFYVGERPLFSEINANVDFYTSCGCTKYEVIGNIYENKELLKNEER